MCCAETLSARSAEFLSLAREEFGVDDLQSLPRHSDQPPVEATRVVVADPSRPSPAEIRALADAFHGRSALAAFECRRTEVEGEHPLIQLVSHLRDVIPARWPVASAPGVPDETTAIRDIGIEDQPSRSLTSQAMAAHQDGWLSLRPEDRGALAVTGLWADSVPVESAATFSQNVVRLSLDLWRMDEEAFEALFDDAAVKILDRSGRIVALSPVLYVKKGALHAFFRERNDEYDVLPGIADAATARAIAFLNAHSSFGSNGTTFTRLDRRGRGLILNNRVCIHGRTAFRDGEGLHQKRVIASKWWASHDDHRDLVWS